MAVMRRLLPALALLLVTLALGCGEGSVETPPRSAPSDGVAAEIQRATAELQGVRDREQWDVSLQRAVAALRVLRDEKHAVGDMEAEAAVRVAYGRHLSMSGDYAGAERELDWVLAEAPRSPHAPAALTEKAGNVWRQGDFAGSKALLEQVIIDYPGSPEAERAPVGIANGEREMAR